MSLTSKQINELRAYAKGRKGELAKLINDAADTIEMLSAKLHASQMERSSQYYHDGWIPCDERLPEEETEVLVTRKFLGVKENNGRLGRKLAPKAYVEIASRIGDDWVAYSDEYKISMSKHTDTIAWMPKPKPYKEDKK